MRWKTFLRSYLDLNRNERIAAVIISTLIVLVYLLPRLFERQEEGYFIPDPALLAALDTSSTEMETEPAGRYEKQVYTKTRSYPGETEVRGLLFPFDPNILDESGWIKLGLREKTARTIINYRNKGGKFYKPEDLSRIWGLPKGFYERIKSYISIPPVALTEKPQRKVFTTAKKSVIININESDTTAFMSLPGIGPKLAGRIAAFRDKLGGFYAVEQVAETYGLPDSTFQKIRSSLSISGEVKKININTASKEELKQHPYIRWNLANAIFEYRKQHGDFKSIEDLKNIILVDEKTFEKIRRYLVL